MTVEAAVLVDRCTVTLGRNVVLDQVDLQVASGASVAIRGANGSGKSTLLRVVAGLIRPDEGEVRVLGGPPTKAAHRTQIGAAIDAPALYGWMSGKGYLRTLLDLAGLGDEGRSDAGLARFGLHGVGRKRIFQYSQGMKKRLSLAAATLGEPSIVLLDEPTNALDRDGVDLVSRWVDAHRAAGGTLLLASHRPRDIELCDSVVDLEDGAISPSRPGRHA